MGISNIQWTTYTFNPWMGCRKVAPECAHCYITSTPPFKFRGLTHGAERVRTAESTWQQPLAWNRKAGRFPWLCPACRCAVTSEVFEDEITCRNCAAGAKFVAHRPRVFCLSLGDWLDDENVPIEWLADLLKLIHDTPKLDWLQLTKRPQNWWQRFNSAMMHLATEASRKHRDSEKGFGDEEAMIANWIAAWMDGKPPANVWIGVSAGANQAAALDIPARVHFLSCEPMLRPMDETHAARFDWIIFGGESGKKARPMDVAWIRDGVKFCADNEIACFVKQMGARPYFPLRGDIMRRGTDEMQFRSKAASSFILDVNEMKNFQVLADSHGGDPLEWPEDLRIRQFPLPKEGR